MTKRDFDKATKMNDGQAFDCGHARAMYRRARGQVDGRDYVAERAARMSRRNSDGLALLLDGVLPTLGIGSAYRAQQAERARRGLPLLDR